MARYTQASKITAGSLFKYLLFGVGIGIGTLGAAAGLIGLLGFPVGEAFGQPLVGLTGLVYGFAVGPVFGLGFALVGVAFAPIGWRIYRKVFGGALLVEVIEDSDEERTET